MLPEQEFIEALKRHIGEKMQLPESATWKQRDFEYLSDLIFEHTGNRISISTLKRIWKNNGAHVPQVYTLNVLAGFAGFESWTHFRQKYRPETRLDGAGSQKLKKRIQFSKRILLPVLLIIITIVLLLQYSKPAATQYREGDVLFKSRKNVSSGVPNTVVFEYDISKISFDSAFIQHTWDKSLRARINKDANYQTFIYYYPGYHTAMLIINDSITRKEYVKITTNGWEALVDGKGAGRLPEYLPGDSLLANGCLYVSKQTLARNEIQVQDREFSVNYFNVMGSTGAKAENFSFETRLRSSIKEGALVCQYVQLTLICQNGMISLPFSHPGCVSNIHLHVSDVLMNGKKKDLSAFGIDLSQWRTIKIKSVNRNLSVAVDEKNIYNLTFTKDLGEITGFHYKFYGCGSVDWIRLFDGGDQLRFSDDFTRKE